MKVLILGNGAREHAIAWKITKSSRASQVFLHPGNGGTRLSGLSSFGNIPLTEPNRLVEEALNRGIGLVVIGPEVLLAKGYANRFRQAGFLTVGPDQEMARLESSKVFAKQFMDLAGIPTAPYLVANSQGELETHLKERKIWPAVLKFDGLAAGKGVCIAENLDQGIAFSKQVFEDKVFGAEKPRVLIEECLSGKEISYIGLCDGKTFLPLASATDYKRVFDGDLGPNTGGMGCLSPSPFFSMEVEKRIQERIIDRILAQFRKDNANYRGALFIGIMIDSDQNPYVLEFNTRFGDPETQATLLRLESDFLSLLLHTAEGTLHECELPSWSPRTSIYVVGTAKGYPQKPKTGDAIEGLELLGSEITTFYAGVEQTPAGLVTSGGRVLGLGCLEENLDRARQKIYKNLGLIGWEGIHYRHDIGLFEKSGVTQ